MTQRKTVDWRGERIRSYAPPVAQRLDYATGEPVCVRCEASLIGRRAHARFCSHNCRSIWHMSERRRRAREAKARA